MFKQVIIFLFGWHFIFQTKNI